MARAGGLNGTPVLNDSDSESPSFNEEIKIETSPIRREYKIVPDLQIQLMLRSGKTQALVLSCVLLPIYPTVSEFRLALMQTPLANPEYDAFLQKWARIFYISSRDTYQKKRRLDNDATLAVLIRDELRVPGTVTFCVEQCRNPKFSQKQKGLSNENVDQTMRILNRVSTVRLVLS
mmetsp:Transcript_1570/g.2814  ORF Transcript_1570/g.2814 Transcript_1570/m.2814 type:complete len:176 (-) Transcript_1570:1060-1587(-)